MFSIFIIYENVTALEKLLQSFEKLLQSSEKLLLQTEKLLPHPKATDLFLSQTRLGQINAVQLPFDNEPVPLCSSRYCESTHAHRLTI